MNFLSITQRLSLIVGVLVLTIAGIVTLESLSFRETMLQERREKLRDMTDSVLAMMKYYDGKVAAGQVGLPEAKAAALLAIRGMRWGSGDYFSIHQFDGVTLLHSNPKFENINRMDFATSDGVRTVEISIKYGKTGGGYYTI